ncbi:hypothetical protein [Actinoplanes sichuanensis]|uniref:Uncharacterized protein n=1 Tax=Actinoplanes sichuanensis TaxID=512349 RepID=A0ABW4ADS5_9ACTN|nr:hypothetical protein [Actinoplanes sichuanensis]
MTIGTLVGVVFDGFGAGVVGVATGAADADADADADGAGPDGAAPAVG